MSNTHNKRVICPYCGYRLPISYSSATNCRGLEVICKGRNCKRILNVIIEDGVQVKAIGKEGGVA